MGWLKRTLSRLVQGKPKTAPEFWNPEGVDRLLNEDLHDAIVAATNNPTAENRRQVIQILSTIVYCIPQTESDSHTITATQNEAGEPVLMVFTDPSAMKRWIRNPPSFLVFTASKLFEFVLENHIAQVVINVSGPDGMSLNRGEVEQLSKGSTPE